MRDEGVIRGAKVNEPIPIAGLSEQDRGGVEGIRDHRRATIGDQIRLHDHPNIPNLREQLMAIEIGLELGPLFFRRLKIEMNDVIIPRMVESQEGALEHVAIAKGAGDEVGEARGSR